MNAPEDIIVACSTGAGKSAISIIRISGFKNISKFQKFFKKDLSKLKPRYAYFTSLLYDENVIDEVVLTYFENPKSYNGENILEVSIHGNPVNVNRVLKFFCTEDSVRLANPGEFSLRAIRNKKLSVSQVEGLDVVLNANSPALINHGLRLMNGDLFKNYKDVFEIFITLKSSIELLIDFSEDVGEEQAWDRVNETFESFSLKVEKLNKLINGHRSVLKNPSVALIGTTNAGKSTLFNKIVGFNRSIVSEVHGTTRDYVSEYIDINGSEFRLVDTAGLRDGSSDDIENEGIRRSEELLNNSFFKVLVVNPFLDKCELVKDFDLVVFTHNDLEGFEGKVNNFNDLSCNNKLSIGESGPIEPFYKNFLDAVSKKYEKLSSENPIIIERHCEKINNIYNLNDNFKRVLKNETDIGIISNELRFIEVEIQELIGIIQPDDVLNEIFSNFCIGK